MPSGIGKEIIMQKPGRSRPSKCNKKPTLSTRCVKCTKTEKFIGKGAHFDKLNNRSLVAGTIRNSGELAPLYYQISRKWV
jgi:hypothetical protein